MRRGEGGSGFSFSFWEFAFTQVSDSFLISNVNNASLNESIPTF